MWRTSFYYEQELRSSYMNDLLHGLIKPGIYNMNAALYTSNDQGQEGIWLRIMPGTMLIFSNTYKVENGIVKRDLTKEGSYLVKCVTDSVENILLAIPGNKSPEVFLSTGTGESKKSKAPVKFIYAKFEYSPNAAASTVPTFGIAVPTSNTDIHAEGSVIATYALPNEGFLSTEADTDVSYLLIGMALDSGIEDQEYASEGSSTRTWRIDEASQYEGSTAWIRNHVFTARGLPDYSGSFSMTHSSSMPGFMFSPSYNRVYLTRGQLYYNSILHSIAGKEWKEIYGQDQTALTSAPDSVNLLGWITDHITPNINADTYVGPGTVDGIPKPTYVLDGDQVAVDFYFLTVQSEYSDIDAELTNLLTAGTFDSTKRILTYRVITTAPSGLFNTQTALIGEDLFNTDKALVPLDISIMNIERLKAFILNKNIIKPVVNKMRRDEDISPFLNPSMGQTLLPLAIAFRKLSVDALGVPEDRQSANSIDACLDVAGTEGASGVNPSNVLSFFELQSTSYAVTGADFAVQETFETLPFLD
jgi:hypothetical protein